MGDEDNVCYEYSNSLEDGRERNKRKWEIWSAMAQKVMYTYIIYSRQGDFIATKSRFHEVILERFTCKIQGVFSTVLYELIAVKRYTGRNIMQH